jgi:hypothetical protein
MLLLELPEYGLAVSEYRKRQDVFLAESSINFAG